MDAEESLAEEGRRVWARMVARHVVVGFVVSLAVATVFVLAWLAVR